MTRTSKKLFLALLVLALGFFSSGAAYANTNQALAHFNKLGQIQASLTSLAAQIRAFPIKNSYCQAPHANDKSGDQAALDALLKKASAAKRQSDLSQRVLNRIITNDTRASAAIDKVAPGGSGSIVDGSHFAGIATLNNAIAAAYRAKITELNNAPTRVCGQAGGNGSSISMPTFVVANPLLDVSTTGAYEPVGQVSLPNRFCHEDEKRQLLASITAMRKAAQANEVIAEKLRDNLRQLEAEIKAKRQAAWNAADAAAKAGQTATQNNQVKQLQAYDAALTKIATGIRQAVAAQRKWRNRDLQLAKDWDAVQGMSISDCTGSNLTPAGTLGGSQIQGLGVALPALNLKPVEIPAIPAKVCVAAVKQEIQAKTFTALQNAWHNRDQWNARIDAINTALKTATGNARQPLIDARAEARKESAKWIKLVEAANTANDSANAIIVEDCSNSGGLLEVGKMSTSRPGVYAGVPEAETQPYDLPEVPEYVCTWEEKQALIARAAKARESASANHSQWGPRASALGALLYGPNAVGGDRTDLLKTHAEARAQTDYWAEQMLDVAHGVYWKLQGLEIRDCDQPENKNSMSSPSGTGGSKVSVLQDAINNRPAINGGGGAQSERDCIIQQGGCFYPDPRNDWMYQLRQGENGFDGSEAENALHDTLRNVDQTHHQDRDRGETNTGNIQENRNQENRAMPGNSGQTHPGAPQMENPSSGNSTGGDVGLELETPPIEYRNGSEPVTPTKLPGLSKYPTINGPRLAPATNTGTNQGGMVQVAPPVLVITTGALDRPTTGAAMPTPAEIEAAGGQ